MPVPKELKISIESVKERFRMFVDKFLWNGDDPDESKKPYNAMVDLENGKINDKWYKKPQNTIADYVFSYTTPVRQSDGMVINLRGTLIFNFLDEYSELKLEDGYEKATKEAAEIQALVEKWG